MGAEQLKSVGRLAVAVAAGVICTSFTTHGMAQEGGETRTVVIRTTQGAVRGIIRNGIQEFLGIPYADPPIGRLRWRPPEPHARWEGVRDATRLGDRCAQVSTLSTFSANSVTEDCLYLNVFKAERASPGQLRPVMVWIYGGGFWEGASDYYNPQKLVSRGAVVLVTIKYRVGLFGFFAHPELDQEGHAFGNYGLMDQQAALRWVQRNARQFGGDPRNVTLFGESAGAYSVADQIISPGAKGLFQRAIAHSNANPEPLTTLEAAESLGSQFAYASGCQHEIPACLREKSVAQILAANPVESANSGGRYFPSVMVDGTVVPDQILPRLQSGRFNRVPLINGSNRDEGLFFVALDELHTGRSLTAQTYADAIRALDPTHGSDILSEYAVADYKSPAEAYGAAFADRIVCEAFEMSKLYSRYVPNTYVYEFADRSAPSYLPKVPYPYEATHTLELQYLFPGFHGATGTQSELSAAQERLSDQMVDYWTHFARSADPNSIEQHLPHWQAVSEHHDAYQQLDLPNSTSVEGQTPKGHHCEFWDELAGRGH